MSIFRRLLGGNGGERAVGAEAAHVPSPAPGAEQAAELAYEQELMRTEAERLSSDLVQRQLRYADRSWVPPAEGGERRADDGDAAGRDG
jgi:hypothetical protein